LGEGARFLSGQQGTGRRDQKPAPRKKEGTQQKQREVEGGKKTRAKGKIDSLQPLKKTQKGSRPVILLDQEKKACQGRKRKMACAASKKSH